MAEPTREQIEACMVPDEWPAMLRHREDTALFMELCALALRALDTEADARLGAKVREINERSPFADLAMRFRDEDMESEPANVLSELAAIMRAEEKP